MCQFLPFPVNDKTKGKYISCLSFIKITTIIKGKYIRLKPKGESVELYVVGGGWYSFTDEALTAVKDK